MNSDNRLSFQIEVKRVLEILSNDIYDSPYALLRENIQNAYDAILIRKHLNSNAEFKAKIDVTINSDLITIEDNGIGMNREVVANNFWKAGSSGKNNQLAKQAGVVGTFGIGAMANFGVCKSIRVITHYAGSNQTIETFAKRESLSITEKCIEIEEKQEDREPGTKVFAELDDNLNLTLQGAIQYLEPYVKFLQVPLFINGTKVSGANYLDQFDVNSENLYSEHSLESEINGFKFSIKLNVTKQNVLKVHCYNIIKNSEPIQGEIVLSQGGSGLYGLRNYFGLASIPANSYFNFGGIVNLSLLHPTAGREALNRESIEFVNQLIHSIEKLVADCFSVSDIADSNSGFLNYISTHNRFDLAKNIKVVVQPNDERWMLSDLTKKNGSKQLYYYSGRDQSTILQFGNENSYLVLLSQENPRRRIQQAYIQALKIPEVPDRAQVTKVYDTKDLEFSEAALVLRITNVLHEDYLIADAKVFIADITHQVPSLVEASSNSINVFISRLSGAVQQVTQIYKADWSLFGSFVKDFVRNHLYQKFAQFVPSSTKHGADALHKILMKNKELYKYEYSDFGEIESLLADYVSGEIEFPEVLKKSSTIMRTHSQFVQQNQVGSVEQEIPSIVETSNSEVPFIDNTQALPPLIRRETNTNKKVLKTDQAYPHLNNFTLFLSLSDKIFRSHLDFFLEPHTTKIIWSMHKVVYVFTHASNTLSLYYDIELKEKLDENSTGGKGVPTTTIITQDKIFVPVTQELQPYFDIKHGTKEFYVRYDIITDFTN